jgi:hypothetical protein
MEIDVTAPRPLAEAALLLEQRFGRMVTYEDAPFHHPDDMIRDEGGRVIPRGGRIVVQYAAEDNLQQVITKCLKAHTHSGYPGMFAAEESDDGYHIVPRGFRDAGGAMEERVPLLDTQITLPSNNRSGLQVVEEIALAVSAARGNSISPGSVPMNALMQHTSAGNPATRSARDQLINLFHEMEMYLSWQLLNNPRTNEFFLNIHSVPEGPEGSNDIDKKE